MSSEQIVVRLVLAALFLAWVWYANRRCSFHCQAEADGRPATAAESSCEEQY